MMDIDRWDVNIVVCIKPYETLKVGYRYDIKGRGNLDYNADPNVRGKTGYGFCIEEAIPDSWKKPYNERIRWHYFTLAEMCEYFITEQEDYQIYLRNQKLDEIIN